MLNFSHRVRADATLNATAGANVHVALQDMANIATTQIGTPITANIIGFGSYLNAIDILSKY